MKIITLDYETEAIEKGSQYSPKPVGVSLKYDCEPSFYWSWGHPTNNNCTLDEVAPIITSICMGDNTIVCHNAKFDIRVCMDWFNVPYPKHVHDTALLAFINNPRLKSYGLKYLAETLLNMPPDDQKEMNEWIVSNVPKATIKNAGKYISLAPGDIVGKYAQSDTDMTYNLYTYLMADLEARGET